MSCEECSKVQEDAFDSDRRLRSIPIAYIRIETGNIAIVGCEKHLKILIERLRRK